MLPRRPVINSENTIRLKNQLFSHKLNPKYCAKQGIYLNGCFTWNTKWGGRFPVEYEICVFKDSGSLTLKYFWNAPHQERRPTSIKIPLVLRTWGGHFFEWRMLCPIGQAPHCKIRARELYLFDERGFGCGGCFNVHRWNYASTPRMIRIVKMSRDPDEIDRILSNPLSQIKEKKIAMAALMRYKLRIKQRAERERELRRRLEERKPKRRWRRWHSAPANLAEAPPADSPYRP